VSRGGDQVGVDFGVDFGVGAGGGVTVPDVGVRTPVGVGPLGEDVGVPVGVPVGEGTVGRVVVGATDGAGGVVPVVPVVLLGWGLGSLGLSMTGTRPEGLVAAGRGAGRTQR
jgi:hypothetical protein